MNDVRTVGEVHDFRLEAVEVLVDPVDPVLSHLARREQSSVERRLRVHQLALHVAWKEITSTSNLPHLAQPLTYLSSW